MNCVDLWGLSASSDNQSSGPSGWDTVAGTEMIALGATIAAAGVASANIPMIVAGVIVIAAGSELAQTGDISGLTEVLEDFADWVSDTIKENF